MSHLDSKSSPSTESILKEGQDRTVRYTVEAAIQVPGDSSSPHVLLFTCYDEQEAMKWAWAKMNAGWTTSILGIHVILALTKNPQIM